jgi:hypothetical protein
MRSLPAIRDYQNNAGVICRAVLTDVARDSSRWRALECPLPKRSLKAAPAR